MESTSTFLLITSLDTINFLITTYIMAYMISPNIKIKKVSFVKSAIVVFLLNFAGWKSGFFGRYSSEEINLFYLSFGALSVIFFLLLFQRPLKWTSIFRIIPAFFLQLCIYLFVFLVLGTFGGKGLFEIMELSISQTNGYYLLVDIFLVLFLLIYNSKRKKWEFELKLMKKDYLLFFVIMILELVYFEFIGMYKTLSGNTMVNTIPVGDIFIQARVSIGIALIVIQIFIFLLILKENKSNYFEVYGKFQSRIMEEQYQYFQRYKESQVETRQMRHDLKNHILCMDNLLKNEKYQELKVYLEGLYESAFQREGMEYNTGNSIADAILSEKGKREECLGNSLEFQIFGVFPQGCNILPMDLCTILSNGVDNAIEACRKLPKEQPRKIVLEILESENGHFLLIRLTNPVKERANFLRNRFFTTKKEKMLHGFGLENIRKTVEKYQGNMEIVQKEKAFTLEIMIRNTVLKPRDTVEN